MDKPNIDNDQTELANMILLKILDSYSENSNLTEVQDIFEEMCPFLKGQSIESYESRYELLHTVFFFASGLLSTIKGEFIQISPNIYPNLTSNLHMIDFINRVNEHIFDDTGDETVEEGVIENQLENLREEFHYQFDIYEPGHPLVDIGVRAFAKGIDSSARRNGPLL